MTDTMRASTAPGQSEATASGAMSTATTVARRTTDEAVVVAKDVREHAHQLVGDATDELRSHAATQTGRLADGLLQAARQLRSMADRADEHGMVVDLASSLADTAQRSAERLEGDGLDGVLEELRRVGRNRSGVFLLGALGAGIVVGRLLRSSDLGALVDTAKDAMGESSPEAPPMQRAESSYAPAAPDLTPGLQTASGLGVTSGGVPT